MISDFEGLVEIEDSIFNFNEINGIQLYQAIIGGAMGNLIT
jgi:hypothetical protein